MSPARGAVAVQDVHHTGGEASVVEQGGEVKEGEGGLFSTLNDNSATSGQGRGQFPRAHK